MISVLSGGTQPRNNLLQPLGHAAHELLQVLGVVHFDDPEPLDLLDPLISCIIPWLFSGAPWPSTKPWPPFSPQFKSVWRNFPLWNPCCMSDWQKVDWVQYVNISVKSKNKQLWMSGLFEFISIEYSFKEINFRGTLSLGVAQEHNFYRPASRPPAALKLGLGGL